MKELKKGDFTGIYSKLDGKPLFFTGLYDYMERGGLPCVWLATDINNNLTYSRWSQQELNSHGWTIAPRPVEISKTARAIIEKAGAVIRWTTAEERRKANTDHKRRSPYILTTASGEYYTTGTIADIRDILSAGKTSKKYGYFVRLYTAGAADRAEIRTESGLPYMDIPAAELDAVRENITRDTNGRATFTTTDERTQPEPIRAEEQQEQPKRRYIFRTFTGWTVYDGITSEKTITAATDEEAEQTARELAAGRAYTVNRQWSAEEDAPETIPAEEAADDPTTPAEETGAAYIVQCRSPRGSWTDYSSPATLEECERVKARAEARRTCDNNGNLLLYHITPTEQRATTERAEPATKRPASTADEETHAPTAKAARIATERARTAPRHPAHARKDYFSEDLCGYG